MPKVTLVPHTALLQLPAYYQAGSTCRNRGQEIDLFDGCVKSFTHLQLGVLFTDSWECRGRPGARHIFTVLVDAWNRGNRDEALFITANLAAKNIPLELNMQEFIVISYFNDAEYAILQVACRILAGLLEGVVDGGNPVTGLHQMMCTLERDSCIRVVSSVRISDLSPDVRTFTTDPIQIYSSIPPVGIIPNNQNLCYAASTLTVLLSQKDIIEKIIAAKDSAVGDGKNFIDMLQLYTWFLRTGGYSRSECAMLNEVFISLPQLSKFSHGRADDCYSFVTTLRELFLQWIPELGKMIGKIKVIPNLIDCELRKKASSAPQVPEEIVIPYRIVETEADRQWSCTCDSTPSKFRPYEREPPRDEMVYAERGGRWLGTLSDIVGTILDGERPRILLLCHRIQVSELPARFAIPCTLVIDDGKLPIVKYSLHGACMYDNQHSEGHYISAIASHTSMYFYDPQYMDSSEDPRVYRPRLLCYALV